MKTLATMIVVTALAAGAQLTHADTAEDLRQFAHAESAHDPRLDVVLNYNDLDLTRVEGAAAMYSRLHAAAEHVCASLPRKVPAQIRHFNTCITFAVSDAVTRLNRPALTAYYRTTLGRNATPVQVAQQP